VGGTADGGRLSIINGRGFALEGAGAFSIVVERRLASRFNRRADWNA